MKEQLIKIWKNKILFRNSLKDKKEDNENLILDFNKFGIYKVYISSFLKNLWNCPEAIYHILINSEIEIVKSNLASFIVNNFYCNYLSGNYLENNLLYVITMMLNDEINELNNIDQIDSFLKDTKAGFLLEELQKMPDIQIYFKNIILKTVERIERTCSFRQINFDIAERVKELIKLREDEKIKLKIENEGDLEEIFKKIIDSKLLDQSINFSKEENSKKNEERYIFFIEKYGGDIKVEEFQERAENAKNENKDDLFNFFNKLEKDVISSNNQEIYSIKNLMNNMICTTFPTHMLSYYINDFLEIISFIEQLIEDLRKNILLLPNSIKSICKIISILIKKKFKNITKTEENSFISKFIVEKILIPIISSPSYKALISDFIISGNALKNIKVMNFIIKKLFSGKLFINNLEEEDYTPFNWFFMDKIEDVFYIFEKTKNINLPNFIDDYINDRLPKDYFYNFFEENKEEIVANISVCFSFDNLNYLIEGMKKSDNIILLNNMKNSTFKKLFSKLTSANGQKDIIKIKEQYKNNNLENSKNNNKDKNKTENYYLYIDNEIEKKYSHLFLINNKIDNFYIDIKNEQKKTKLKEEEKIIIKVKNYLCNSLGNYRLLNKSDFNTETTLNIIELLKEIKLYMSLPNFILSNNTIPSVWYINSILDYLNKIPENYKKNDYKILFDEITQNLNDSIKILDFEKLIIFKNKTKFTEKMYSYYENLNELINNIKINKYINTIVEKENIPIDIKFNYDDKEKVFDIIKIDSKKKIAKCETIEAFTKYFPNIGKYQIKQGINPLDIIKELSINRKLDYYLGIIKEKLIKNKIVELKKYEDSYSKKIKDYIMNKIFDKIYPPEPNELDNKIFSKTISLSWIEPNEIMEKDYIFDNMLPDILNEFNKICIVKTPFQKLNCLRKILSFVINLIKFNETIDKEVGAEDITPVLNYVFIKAHPINIFTDIEFIKLFETLDSVNENIITNFELMNNLILKYSAESFHLSEMEFKRRCVKEINKK